MRRGPRSKVNLTQLLIDLTTPDPDTNELATFSKLAVKHGITRERVRQLAKHYAGITGSQRVTSHSYKLKPGWRLQWPKSGRVFTRIIRNILGLIDHGWCGHCWQAVPLKLMHNNTASQNGYHKLRCKKCVAIRVNHWYHLENGREKQYAWVKANPEKVRQHQRKYQQKRSQRKLDKIMEDWDAAKKAAQRTG